MTIQTVWNARHPEKRRAMNKRWRDNNKDKVREMAKRHYYRHHEKNIERSRQWKAANPDKVKAQSKEWNAQNVEKIREASRRVRLRKKYNLTPEAWESLFEAQGRKCATCDNASPKRFHTDHCHTSGAVRGILCSPCNLAVGHLRDDPKIARAIARYLENESDELLRKARPIESPYTGPGEVDGSRIQPHGSEHQEEVAAQPGTHHHAEGTWLGRDRRQGYRPQAHGQEWREQCSLEPEGPERARQSRLE